MGDIRTLDTESEYQPYINLYRNGNKNDVISWLHLKSLYLEEGKDWDEEKIGAVIGCMGEDMPNIYIPCLNTETGEQTMAILEYGHMSKQYDIPIVMLKTKLR
jgi:hypothetical protein